jgi:transposase
VELWAEDECRLGLKPAARRVWALKGTRPTCNGQHRFQWLYVYGFAEPSTGRTVSLILPRVNTELMSQALAEFARQADPDGKKVLVLLVDNAGWHTSKRLAVPANVVLHRLPPCTPELQPVEHLWPLLREAVANRTLADLAELEERLKRRTQWLADHRDVAKGAVGFHWAVKIAG